MYNTNRQNEYRHILKGSEVAIERGKLLTKHIKIPNDYYFNDALLYRIGINESLISEAQEVAQSLNAYLMQKNK